MEPKDKTYSLEQVGELKRKIEMMAGETYLKFKKAAVEILCEAARKRKEDGWAVYFEKKYSL